MAITTYKGRQIYYEHNMQEGKNVVFLHGFCENSHIWRYVTEDVPFGTVSIDFPGFGKSEMTDNISMNQLSDIVRHVVDELEISDPILIGHSLGAYVALAYANARPEHTSALGIINSHPFADNNTRVKERNKSIQFIKKHGDQKFIALAYEQYFYSQDSYLKNTKQHLIDLQANVSAETLITYIKAMRDRDSAVPFMEKWPRPFLILLGAHDELIPWEKQVSQASLAQISELVIMQNSGHMALFEERIKSREAIVNFIDFVSLMEEQIA